MCGGGELKRKKDPLCFIFSTNLLPPSFRRYTCTHVAHGVPVGRRRRYTPPRCQVAGRKPPADAAVVDSARRVLSYLLSSSSSSLTRYYRRIALSSVKCFYRTPLPPHHRHHRCSCGMNRVRYGTVASRCVQKRYREFAQARRNGSRNESTDVQKRRLLCGTNA